MTGYSRLSHGLELGPSASQKNPLDRDLKNYEKNAKDYCLNIMKEQKRELKEGETVVKLVEPDPLLFWKIQVIISIFFTSNFWLFFFYKDASREYKTQLPKLALDLFCIPSTSIPSERLFSISGLLSSNHSSSITAKNLEKRCIIKANKML